MTSVTPSADTANASADARLVSVFRTILTALSGLTVLGAILELTFLRHWDDDQRWAWVIVAIIAVGVIAYAIGRGPTNVLVARVLGGVGVLGSGYGVLEHVHANVKLGEFEPEYASTWSSTGTLQQWWLAATGSVGPAPALAPGMLGLAGLMLILATWGAARRSAS